MSKRGKSFKGWKYRCVTCGYTTLDVGQAVDHVNKNRGHQLRRIEL